MVQIARFPETEKRAGWRLPCDAPFSLSLCTASETRRSTTLGWGRVDRDFHGGRVVGTAVPRSGRLAVQPPCGSPLRGSRHLRPCVFPPAYSDGCGHWRLGSRPATCCRLDNGNRAGLQNALHCSALLLPTPSQMSGGLRKSVQGMRFAPLGIARTIPPECHLLGVLWTYVNWPLCMAVLAFPSRRVCSAKVRLGPGRGRCGMARPVPS